jgi:hypothetical protein
MSFKKILTLAKGTLITAGADVADGSEQDIGQLHDFVFELRGTIGLSTSLNVKVQDSFDDGDTWHDVALGIDPLDSLGGDFGQMTGDDAEVLVPLRPMGGKIRALRTSVDDGFSYTLRAACNPQG